MKFAALLVCVFVWPTSVTITDVTDTHLPATGLSKNSMDVVPVDIDRDSDDDLVVACEFCPNIILINDGSGKFANESATRLPQKNHDSEDIAAEDFDLDGDIDLVFVSEDDKVHEYYFNDGKGNFTEASDKIPMQSICNAVCAVDIDKDGDKDLVLGNAGQDLLFQNNGKGLWTNITATHFPSDNDVTQDVKTFDADRDGDPDLVFGNEDAGKIYLNDGKGRFTLSANALPNVVTTVETRKVEVEDIDKDGDMDLFFCNVSFRPGRSRQNLLLLNDGKGKFSDASAERYLGQNDLMSLDAQFVDLNTDGWKDLVVSNGFGGRLQYFENKNGRFTEMNDASLPSFPGIDVISLKMLNSGKEQRFLYLGVFRGKDRLLEIK
jgi:hypothetical protein